MTPAHIPPGGRPLVGFEKVLMNPAFFEEAAFWSKLFRLRDRLRCPDCGKVGTWKMHGTQWDRWRHGDRHAYRWLCKWCGYYIGPEGARRAWPSIVTGAWQIEDLAEEGDEETRVPADYMPDSASVPGKKVNPWAG